MVDGAFAGAGGTEYGLQARRREQVVDPHLRIPRRDRETVRARIPCAIAIDVTGREEPAERPSRRHSQLREQLKAYPGRRPVQLMAVADAQRLGGGVRWSLIMVL